jgi:hypothetical protein
MEMNFFRCVSHQAAWCLVQLASGSSAQTKQLVQAAMLLFFCLLGFV